MRRILMKTIFAQGLVAALFFCFIPVVAAEPTTTYTVSAQATEPDGLKMYFKIYRDGARERIEVSFAGTGASTTLIDFWAHKVYWIGSPGQATCSEGRYLSARAPIVYDPITARTESLPKTNRKFVRAEVVNGIPTRLEEIAPVKRSDKPLRVWLADPGDFVVKLEGKSAGGKSMIVYEVTQWSADKPAAESLLPPANCVMTNSEMGDSGEISSHAEGKVEQVEVSGTKKFGDK
jgi:hypothetical protein